MEISVHTLYLVVASVITLGAIVPYLLDIFKGKTKPNIVSWTTWTLLTVIATFAEFTAKEYTTAIFTSSAVLATGLVVGLGLKYGYSKYSVFDFICQIGALIGLILWWFFNDPALAVIASVTIDFIGALPTLRHSWLRPNEETWITYALSSFGGIFAVLALTSFNFTSLSYPVYMVFSNLLLFTVILIRTQKKKASKIYAQR